jgi:rhamnose utilization protein RhaD (predicted bifunctional aldolase and dehydrogenase)
MSNDVMSQLVALSNRLGQPDWECAILGEGNTSARADEQSFFVKASGHELRTIAPQGFVQVAFERVLALLNCGDLSDQAVKDGLAAAKIDPAAPGHPSVETLLHGIFLSLEGVTFVGHTHPIAVNSITCSQNFEAAYAGRLFPDEIVVCGIAPLLVPYIDPGIPLARHVYQLLQQYLDRYGEAPKTVIMQNHGLIALGRSAQQVETITQMAVKTARILLGTFAAGGPRFMSEQAVQRIHSRPDEHYRQRQLKLM